VHDIAWAQWLFHTPSFALGNRPRTAAQAAGCAYEKRGIAFVERSVSHFVPKPWLQYRTRHGRPKWCQPDGVYFDFRQGLIIVVEFKRRHTTDAYSQTQLYQSVLRHLFPKSLWGLGACEVTGSFDCDVYLPVRPRFVNSFQEITDGDFGVLLWKPTKHRKKYR
jgi:hypothetical protein